MYNLEVTIYNLNLQDSWRITKSLTCLPSYVSKYAIQNLEFKMFFLKIYLNLHATQSSQNFCTINTAYLVVSEYSKLLHSLQYNFHTSVFVYSLLLLLLDTQLPINSFKTLLRKSVPTYKKSCAVRNLVIQCKGAVRHSSQCNELSLISGIFLSVQNYRTHSFVAVTDRRFTSMAFSKLTYNLMYK